MLSDSPTCGRGSIRCQAPIAAILGAHSSSVHRQFRGRKLHVTVARGDGTAGRPGIGSHLHRRRWRVIGRVAVVGAANVAGRLDGRMHPFTFIAPALAIAATLVMGLMLVDFWWQFVVVRVTIALVAGAVPTLAFSAVANQASASQRSTVVGMATSVGMLGWAASPYISGLMVGSAYSGFTPARA